MPIVHSDRISGTIYVISQDAERAGDLAMDYLRTKGTAGDDRSGSLHVFDHQKDADAALYNRFGTYDTDRDRVYALSLDIRVADA